MIRFRTNILYHLLHKIGKKPNADHFQFMKWPAHKRTKEEMEFVFDHLGWNYSPINLCNMNLWWGIKYCQWQHLFILILTMLFPVYCSSPEVYERINMRHCNNF